jgi:uncharacterized protein YPO0396
MQLSVFSTDNQKSGFRLQYMEVFNWGTFDEIIHAIYPGGETSLLTGANGSGKTTFVDALLTLIVPEKRYRFYNQSSGSDRKGDRTEETYVLGGYGTINSESTGASKTLYLRENREEAYSIILAHFSNEAQQYVTLFQVRYFTGNEMKRFFGIAHKPLTIESDFKPFDLGGVWKKTIDNRYNKGSKKFVEWFDAASKYAQRMVDVLGMQSIQALHLFNQTVGIKVLGNLDEFIRTHMLEPRNMEEQFQDLKKHLATLLEARRNIEKSEEQLAMLHQVKLQYDNYELGAADLKRLNNTLHTATIWHKYTKRELLQAEIAEVDRQIATYKQKIKEQKAELDRLSEEQRNLLNQIEQDKAGQRLQQLEKDLQELHGRKEEAMVRVKEFENWMKTLHLSETNLADEAAYQRIKKENDTKALTLQREQRLNEEDDYDAKRKRDQAAGKRTEIETELNNLLGSKNNIPSTLVVLRRQICEALGLTTDELPFAGELMQVKSAEREWEPAMEKLLRHFSLRLLVPDKVYKKVNKYVNNHNLKARLVYEHVTAVPLTQYADKGTVYEKLEFNPDHKLSDWVEQQVIRQFSYFCLPDDKTLDRYEKAITLNGLVKNGQRHEKDDRPDRNDATRYVMGWNNENKKQALLRNRDQLSATITEAEEIIQRCQNKSKRLQDQLYANNRIREYAGFASLDVAGIQQTIHKYQEQVTALTRASKVLNQLKNQLEDVGKQKEIEADKQDFLIREEGVADNKLKALRSQAEEISVFVDQITEPEKDLLLQFQQEHSQLLVELNLQNLDRIYSDFRDKLDKEITQIRQKVQKAENELSRAIFRVRNPSAELSQKYPDWIGDVVQMPEDPQYASEYIEWMDKLNTENLPKYKKDFENYINVTITYKIGGLNEELEKWERDIHTSIIRLNQSLGGINFNRLPDTYVQLRKNPVQAGSEIREFKTRLLEALPQAANWQQSSFEEKSLHFTDKIHPLIQNLDANESYRNKVLDVRNWFEFWADEKYRGTEELKKTYRQMGQLSGGEKAQLTYTILCSAIAYQFGITKEGQNSRSLRFIAVDESFSNQDEEKATYLMELCKQLHLQLLVVTPSDKIQIVQDFIAHVHLVQRVNNRHSVIYNMTVKEIKGKMEEV